MRRLNRGGLAALVAMAVVAGVVASGLLVFNATQAAFTDTTTNGSNAWTAGTVVLNNESASVMFNVGAIKPGQSGERCMVVTYNGDLAASVKLYASASSGTLRPYLSFSVALDDTGSYASCGAFTPESTPYTGTLDDFCANRTGWGTGVGTWTPTGTGQSRVYRLSWTLDPAITDAFQGAQANATFTWEAQNT